MIYTLYTMHFSGVNVLRIRYKLLYALIFKFDEFPSHYDIHTVYHALFKCQCFTVHISIGFINRFVKNRLLQGKSYTFCISMYVI